MKNLKKALALFLAMLMILAVSPVSAFAAEDGADNNGEVTEEPENPENPEEPEVTPEVAWYTSFNLKSGEGTLAEAAAKVVRTGKIVLLRDITVDETVSLATTATIEGEGFTVKRGDAFSGVMFTVGNNAKLTFKNVTVDGNADAFADGTDSVLHILEGNVILEENAVITNNHAKTNSTVVVGFNNSANKTESSLTLKDGAVISDCSAAVGGAVSVEYNSICNLRGGVIKNCSSTIGGAVNLSKSGAELSILNGEISGCSATVGGAVFAAAKTSVIVSDGTITANETTSGRGAVYMSSGATITVSDAVNISGNKYDDAESNIYLEKGVIIKVDPAFTEGARIGITAEDFDAERPTLNFIDCEGDVSGILFNDADHKTFFKTASGVTLEAAVKVTFDPAKGTCAVGSKFFASGKAFGVLPQPDERDGFDFLGWYTADGNPVTASTIVPAGEDITLTAKWENLNKLDTNPFAVIGRFFERIGDMLRMVFQFLSDMFTGTGDKHIKDL